jgi:uncharacterized Rmd1/YagE family protein
MQQALQAGRLLEDEYLVVSLPDSAPTPTISASPPLAASQSSAALGTPSPMTTIASPSRRRSPTQREVEDLGDEEKDQGRHCVYFSHGAVVFFNCDEKTQADCIEQGKKFTTKPKTSAMETEEFELEVEPSLSRHEWGKLAHNKLILQSLDLKSVSVISSVLAQAVALRHFEDEIDKLLENLEKSELDALKILKESNKVVRDVILTLGLLDHASKSSPAWHEARYHHIWVALRDEFEIEKRWRVLETKTSFLQDNLKFAVELANARTSERMEIAIIALISAELFVSVLHLVR